MAGLALILLRYIAIAMASSAIGTGYQSLSHLEKKTVDEGLAIYGLEPASDPSGMLVREIFIFTASPFSGDSGFLTAFNHLHINTRVNMIRKKLFQRQGRPYSDELIAESELLLREESHLRSVAVIVPVFDKKKARDQVDLLVATRDILSLQARFSLEGTFAKVTALSIGIVENNLLGLNKAVSMGYDLDQGSHAILASYFDPGIFGSPLELTLKPSLIFTRDRFKLNGFAVGFDLERPLRSQSDRFGYGVDLSIASTPIYDFKGDELRTIDLPGTEEREAIEKRYRLALGKGSAHLTYSMGRRYKKNISISYNLSIKRPSPVSDMELTDEQREYLIKYVLPKSEIESFIKLGFKYFNNNFLTLYDYEKFALQETVRTGPVFSVFNELSWRDVMLGDHDFVRPGVKFSWLQPFFKDSFIFVKGSGSFRFDGALSDNAYGISLKLVSPKVFGLARGVADGGFSSIGKSRDNRRFVLGSESGVRGVGHRHYSGNTAFQANFEIRSSALEVWIFHTGLVLFYDVGAAFDKPARANPTHAVGVGMRLLAPQVSSIPFRFDLAFPLYGPGRDLYAVVPSFGMGQAF